MTCQHLEQITSKAFIANFSHSPLMTCGLGLSAGYAPLRRNTACIQQSFCVLIAVINAPRNLTRRSHDKCIKRTVPHPLPSGRPSKRSRLPTLDAFARMSSFSALFLAGVQSMLAERLSFSIGQVLRYLDQAISTSTSWAPLKPEH